MTIDDIIRHCRRDTRCIGGPERLALCDEVERLRVCEFNLARIEMLCLELDEELDGVKLPKSAAAVANGIRVVLDEMDDGMRKEATT